ncbi:ribosomal protein L39E [Streptomyces luteogriseus]|uniref:AAA family ATPase n=1 Tax=Streptomyces luteogriseus TaxID=68233 RepID=UPI0027868F28|nr:AAA family ATPase [Streptomyces luteogriseus]MDQ0713484.1 ribosomal protein L39E [Streptomyces luteogriseus]
MSASTPRQIVVVHGDALADWVVAQQDEREPRRTTGPKWQDRQGEVRQREIPGGTRLLTTLIDEVSDDNVSVWSPTSSWGHIDWFDERISHYHATLAPFPETEKVEDLSNPAYFRWRISDDQGISRRKPCDKHDTEERNKCYGLGEPDSADLVVIADAGLRFYEDHELPKAIKDNRVNPPWLILKIGGDGMLDRKDRLRDVLPNLRDKVILVTTADDLRRVSGLEITRGTAWERAASDCFKIFESNERINRYRFVVVSFGPAGVFLFDRDRKAGGDCSIFYNPVKVEGAPDFWLNGRMWGYTSTLCSAIALEVLNYIDKNDAPLAGSPAAAGTVMNRAVRRGLKAMQEVYRNGFGPVIRAGVAGQTESAVPDFPTSAIKTALQIEDSELADDRHIAEGQVAGPDIDSSEMFASGLDLKETARQIIYHGAEKALADTNIPFLKYGDVITVDRREIESFQSVRSLVKEYAERTGTRIRRHWHRKDARTPVPLSIAIFGQPGSGKSTAVREVIGSIKVQDKEFTFEEFNLSQFRDPSELIDSFHLLRDVRLQGKVPVVLWDEFDSFFERPMGWLRYFLSPMQDGTFQEGKSVHPIGRSVFVFAGGVTSSLDEFQSRQEDGADSEAKNDFKAAKGPDFLSRVRGTMELQGIDKSDSDPFWVIRRAILLRSILKKESVLLPEGQSAEEAIDKDVLNAFLSVPKFNHGVRSMRAIVANSSLLGERFFSKSSLPNASQLKLHVNVDDFAGEMSG